MTRVALVLSAAIVLVAAAAGPSFSLTASDCAKLENSTKKDECVRSLGTAGKSGTTPAVPANPTGPGPATPATPAVPGKGKGR
jgi:hypothetical protein